MKESLYGIDRNLIFRETFNSESDVIRNGGSLVDVSFDNGVGSFNGTSSMLFYKFNKNIFNEDFSIRCIITVNSGYGVIFDFRLAAYMGIVFYLYNNSIYFSYGNNTVSVPIENFYSKKTECILTFEKNGSIKLYYEGSIEKSSAALSYTLPDVILGYIGGKSFYSPSLVLDGSIDFLEIYNKALTQEEVTNLYNKTTYRDIRDGLILDIDARNGVIEDRCGNALVPTNVAIKKDSTNVIFFSDIVRGEVRSETSAANLQALTVSLWVKNKHYKRTSDRIFALYKNDGAIPYIMYDNATNRYVAYISNGLGILPVSYFTKDVWEYYSIVFKTSGTSIYKNGVLEDESLGVQSLPNFDYALFGLNDIKTFGGYQNQMRIYNRVLSSTEIMQLYTSQRRNYE